MSWHAFQLWRWIAGQGWVPQSQDPPRLMSPADVDAYVARARVSAATPWALRDYEYTGDHWITSHFLSWTPGRYN